MIRLGYWATGSRLTDRREVPSRIAKPCELSATQGARPVPGTQPLVVARCPQLFFADFREEPDFFAAPAFAAVDLVPVDLVPVDLVPVDVGADDFLEPDLVVDAFAAVDLVADDFAGAALVVALAVAFLAAERVDDAFDEAFLVEDLAAPARFAGDVEAVDLLPVEFVADAADIVDVDAFGSFFAPETMSFKFAPARNFGTAFFLARFRSFVRGLRTIRDSRTTFSNAPKPVMATFSPLTTSRVIVSRTESSAFFAATLLPS